MYSVNSVENASKNVQDQVWMKDRRPLQPELATFKELKSSYFSDRIPVSVRKEKSFEELQNLSLGKYAGSTSKIICSLPFREEFRGVYSVAFSGDGSVLVIGLGSGDVKIYDKKNSKSKVTFKIASNHPITCVKFHPLLPEFFFAGSTAGVINLCNFEGEPKLSLVEKNNEVNTVDIDMYGMRLITAGKDACIRAYNPESKQLIQMYGTTRNNETNSPIESHKMRIYCLKFHPTFHNIFVSGGWDGAVKIWDVRSNEGLVRSIEGPFINGDAIDLKDNKILTGSNRGKNNLQLWDFGSGLLINDVIPRNRLVSLDGDMLYTAKFFSGEPSGDLITCGGGGYGSFRVVSLTENLIVQTFPEKRPIVSSCCFENEICFGSMSGNCYVVKYFIGGEKEEEKEMVVENFADDGKTETASTPAESTEN